MNMQGDKIIFKNLPLSLDQFFVFNLLYIKLKGISLSIAYHILIV